MVEREICFAIESNEFKLIEHTNESAEKANKSIRLAAKRFLNDVREGLTGVNYTTSTLVSGSQPRHWARLHVWVEVDPKASYTKAGITANTLP
jgi:hypothetical protein